MRQSFNELLLSELNMVTYKPGDPESMTDTDLCKAVTLNENLKSLGYTLKPADILKLAVSSSLDSFYVMFTDLLPEVKDKPMYPDFPQQVMQMEEAEFRLHQYMHYFSTYGLELLFGREVVKGWLPYTEYPERTQKDTDLMEARVIELVDEEEAAAVVLHKILSRRERLTNPELDLVEEFVPSCQPSQLEGLQVRFKENLELLFPRLMTLSEKQAALVILHAICQHTGDVFRCSKDYLHSRKWHLKTSEKKMLVKLLESYNVTDLRQNMIQSQCLRERNLQVLKHLDYNRFSRSEPHREAVRALRNRELLSWHGVGEALLKDRKPEALAHFAERPGYMLRIINRLLSLGYNGADIEKSILPAADKISAHLILKTIRTLTSIFHSQTVEILKAILKEHFRKAQTCLAGKRVYLDLNGFDLIHSTLETEDKSKDGGYIRSGISYKIPEKAKYVRFFVYWNDKRRVDVDLHAGGLTTDGQNLHVGWNADFRRAGVVHSGDITHSDAAEYIDIDLAAPIKEIYANIHLFSGKKSFKDVDTCYVGLMAVDKIGQDVKHYDPKNCFFTHALTQNTRNLYYGYIDVQNRFVRYVGQPNRDMWESRPAIEPAEDMFSIQDYLDCILEAQNAAIADSPEDAELVLTMGKSLKDNAVSLVDNNFFLEC